MQTSADRMPLDLRRLRKSAIDAGHGGANVESAGVIYSPA
jgi:hypothetical protein